jgi:hypothetical protein
VTTFTDGKDLIAKMREVKGLQYWSSWDLIDYLIELNDNRNIILLDPQNEDHCFELNGSFTIPEIEAMFIAQVNDRGHMRAG